MHSETNHAKADLKFAAAWGPKCCNPVLIGCHERELISFVKKTFFPPPMEEPAFTAQLGWKVAERKVQNLNQLQFYKIGKLHDKHSLM